MYLALEAVIDIAYHGGVEPVQSQDIAERLGLPRRYLEQVMQQLVRSSILRGVRGPRGGYRLAKERRRITVGDIVRVVQSMDASAQEDDHSSPSELGRLVVAPFWVDAEQELMQRLDRVTVEELCKHADRAGVRSFARAEADFVI